MMLYLKIAFRNLWRHTSRTLLVVTLISTSLMILIFLNGFYDGMLDQMIRDSIYSDINDVTIYHPNYRESKMISNHLIYPPELIDSLNKMPEVEGIYPRLKADGMIQTARFSRGTSIIGFNSSLEENLSLVKEKIISGNITTSKRSAIIGKKLAQKLHLSLKNKVVLTTQDISGNIAADVFRITGIFQTNNPELDQRAIFINLDAARHLVKLPNGSTQLSIKAKKPEKLSQLKQDIQKRAGPSVQVLTWGEQLGAFKQIQSMTKVYNQISFIIVFCVVAIGVFNAMFVTITERTREFGIMMAIGNRFRDIACMVTFEAVMIGLMGYIIGSVLGLALLASSHYFGINFGSFSESIETFGMASVVYPSIKLTYFKWSFFATMTSIIGAIIWPLWNLFRLKPIRAINF